MTQKVHSQNAYFIPTGDITTIKMSDIAQLDPENHKSMMIKIEIRKYQTPKEQLHFYLMDIRTVQAQLIIMT